MDRQVALTLVKVWVAILCVGWIALIGWREFVLREDYSGYRQAFQPLSECSGSFQSRYECRSSAMISKENAEFYSYGKRLALVFLPPIALLYLFGKYRSRQEKRRVEEARQAAARRRRAPPSPRGEPQAAAPAPTN